MTTTLLPGQTQPQRIFAHNDTLMTFLQSSHTADSFMSNNDKTNNFLGALHRIRDASESRKQAILDTVKMIHVYDHLGYELRHYISALTKLYKKTEEPHWRRLRRAISK